MTRPPVKPDAPVFRCCGDQLFDAHRFCCVKNSEGGPILLSQTQEKSGIRICKWNGPNNLVHWWVEWDNENGVMESADSNGMGAFNPQYTNLSISYPALFVQEPKTCRDLLLSPCEANRPCVINCLRSKIESLVNTNGGYCWDFVAKVEFIYMTECRQSCKPDSYPTTDPASQGKSGEQQ